MASRPTTDAQVSPRRYRFASYELDARTGELHKLGMKLRLQDKPLQILLALLERPGEVVDREHLIARLWPPGTFVDFDLALNAAVRRLRDLLNDSAENPRYIETLPRLGYRFIAAVEVVAEPEAAPVPAVQEEPSVEQAVPMAASRWSLRVAIAAGLLLLALATGLGGWRWTQPRAKVEFSQRDWVLISQFENRTGNPSLDGSLETLLEREISNSHYVNVAPQERVRDTMRLMRLQMEGRPALAAAREVAVRDGGIKAVIAGKVERIGGRYVLGTSVVLPADGVTVSSYTEDAESEEQVVPALRRLSDRLRQDLGENLTEIQRSDEALEKVTTPSLPALQLYSRANRLMIQSEGQLTESEYEAMQAEAAVLLQQALAVEPDFASGHLLLAYALSNSGHRKEGAPQFRRAFELAGTVSERERLFIQGSYYESARDWERARQAYESLLALYPEDYWTANNLVNLDYRQQRPDRALELVVLLADLRPRDFESNYWTWWWLDIHRQRERARAYYLHAQALVTPEMEQKLPKMVVALEVAPLREAWARSDLKTAVKRLQKLKNEANIRTGDLRQATILELYDALLGFGQVQEADHWTDLISDPGQRAYAKVRVAEARHDAPGALRAALLEQLRLKEPLPSERRLARAGLLRQAQNTLRQQMPRVYPAQLDWSAGEIALAQGRLPEAVAKLRAAVAGYQQLATNELLDANMALAEALEREGKTDEAIRVLAPEVEADVIYDTNNARLQLARLYRRQGRPKEAEKLEQAVRQSLAYADPDHPLLRDLQQRPSPGPTREQ